MAKCGNIPMNTSAIMNAVTMQRCRYYSKFPMKFPLITNVLTMQRRRCYTNIPMDEFRNINALMVQLGTSCSFDSPGLARNEPTPGQRLQGDSTP